MEWVLVSTVFAKVENFADALRSPREGLISKSWWAVLAANTSSPFASIIRILRFWLKLMRLRRERDKSRRSVSAMLVFFDRDCDGEVGSVEVESDWFDVRAIKLRQR